jgi:hypothetical protein
MFKYHVTLLPTVSSLATVHDHYIMGCNGLKRLLENLVIQTNMSFKKGHNTI